MSVVRTGVRGIVLPALLSLAMFGESVPLIGWAKFIDERLPIGNAKPHGGEDGAARLIRRDMAGPGDVVILCGDAGTVR